LVIDGSGTITDADWTIIVNALSNVVNATVPHDGSVELTIVQFGYNGSLPARTDLTPTVMNNATYVEVANSILGIPKLGGSTSMADGLYLAWKELKSSANFQGASKHVIYLATDGIPNIRNGNATIDLNGDGLINAYDDVISVANGSANQGLTELDMELIGISDASAWFRDNLVYPQPGVFAPPYSKAGWVHQVAGIDEFAGTMSQSFQALVGASAEEVWVPSANGALAAGAVTLGATVIVYTAIASKIGELLPNFLKKWLGEFTKSKRKLYARIQTGSPFKVTKFEAIAYALSLSIIAVGFAYAKSPTLNEILTILPAVLATSIIVEFAKNYVQATVARTRGVWSEYRLWYFGMVLFAISVLAFRVPFSEPGRITILQSSATKKIKGLMATARILNSLAFASLFYVLFISGFTLIGNIGLVMCITVAFIESIPIPLMKGKEIYDWNKYLSIGIFLLTLALYVLMIFKLE
jgi:hypothetical protein